jgi:phospholipid-binding lipoprotein MlaA
MRRKISGNRIPEIVMMLFLAVVMFGCSGAPVRPDAEVFAKRPVSEFVKPDVRYPVDAYDPWEGLNRRIYRFNAVFDRYVFLPVVNTYEFILPDFAEDMISNFFDNFGELENLLNTMLQGKFNEFFITVGRVALNSTAGVLGLFDPATTIGIDRQNEDFGQTLGFYGVGSGPYLVLPLLGPSTLRDTGGLIADALVHQAVFDYLVEELDVEEEDLVDVMYSVLNAIDERHKQGFRYYATGSPFEYELIRMLYLNKREIEIEN